MGNLFSQKYDHIKLNPESLVLEELFSQLTITCLKSAIGTPRKGVKYVQSYL